MNHSKLERELSRIFTSKIDGWNPEDGDVLYAYFLKRYKQGKICWSLKEISETSIHFGNEIEEIDGQKQVIINGTYEERSDGYFNIADAETHEVSSIYKCKEKIKETICELWKVCFPNHYYSEDQGFIVNIESCKFSVSNLRLPQKSDFKITTKYADNSAFHLGRNPNQDYEFKLGVNWAVWHRYPPTRRLNSLTHELCHCIHAHHKREFWIQHAESIHNLTKSNATKSYAENLLGEINWNKLKTYALKGPHRQPEDIDITGYPNRREACNNIHQEMGEILNYKLEIGKTFHTDQPLSELHKPVYRNADEDEYEKIQIGDVSGYGYEDLTDEELYEFLNQEFIYQDEHGIRKYDCSIDDCPVINDNNEVIENEKFARLCARMINKSDIGRHRLDEKTNIYVKRCN